MQTLIKYPLPDGWTWLAIGECCDVFMGQSPKSATYNAQKNGLPFFQGKTEFGETHPVVRKWCNAPIRIAEKEDVLISVRAPVGPVNIADTKCCIGRGLAALRPKKKMLTTKWLFWYLKSVEHIISKMGTGTTFTAISGDTLRGFSVPLPPLEKQKEILAHIEALFGRLDSVSVIITQNQKALANCRHQIISRMFCGAV